MRHLQSRCLLLFVGLLLAAGVVQHPVQAEPLCTDTLISDGQQATRLLAYNAETLMLYDHNNELSPERLTLYDVDTSTETTLWEDTLDEADPIYDYPYVQESGGNFVWEVPDVTPLYVTAWLNSAWTTRELENELHDLVTFSGDYVLWQTRQKGNKTLKLHIIATNETRILYTNIQEYWAETLLAGDTLIWRDKNIGAYMLHRITSNETRVLWTKPLEHILIEDGYVFWWKDTRTGRSKVFMHDIEASTTTRLFTSTGTLTGMIYDDGELFYREYVMYGDGTSTHRASIYNLASAQNQLVFERPNGIYTFQPLTPDTLLWTEDKLGMAGTYTVDVYLYDRVSGVSRSIPNPARGMITLIHYDGQVMVFKSRIRSLDLVEYVYVVDLLSDTLQEVTVLRMVFEETTWHDGWLVHFKDGHLTLYDALSNAHTIVKHDALWGVKGSLFGRTLIWEGGPEYPDYMELSVSSVFISTCANAPTINDYHTDYYVHTGDDLTITPGVYGDAPLAVQWYAGLQGDTSTPVGGDSPVLALTDISQTAHYWLRATNPLGVRDTATITVHVGDSHNVLSNAGFEEELSGDWITTSYWNPSVKCNRDRDNDGIIDLVVAYEGDCAMRFKANLYYRHQISQTIPLDKFTFAPDDSLTLSAYVKVHPPESRLVAKLIVQYDDGVTANGKVKFVARQTSGYAFFSSSPLILQASAVSSMKVSFIDKSHTGNLWLDNTALIWANGGAAESSLIEIPPAPDGFRR